MATMTRRILRFALQILTLCFLVACILFLLDNEVEILPNAIHDRLPAHHPGSVITDIALTECSILSIFNNCDLNDVKWHRIEKDLYLGGSFFSKAYLHVRREELEGLGSTDAVIVDIKTGRLDPSKGEDGQVQEGWESRPAGIWIKRSTEHHRHELSDTVTGLDILFGSDAVDPRPSWQVQGIPLLFGQHSDGQEPRLTVHRGPPSKVDKHVPRINQNGKFKIMQVADLHLSTGLGKCRDALPVGFNSGECEADPRTLEFVEKMIDDETPDLVVLSGDQVNGETAKDAQSAIFKFAELFQRRRVPYAAVFGNHDDEGDLDRASSMSLLENLPFSLSEAGPPDIDGVGNYFVEILGRGSSTNSALTLYLLDTHSYSPNEQQYKGYDWLKANQIDWFKKTADNLKKKHEGYTHMHMNLAFFHIPLPEYRNRAGHEIVGNWTEPPTAPAFNSGFKDALIEKGVLLVSCGHDHVNDYCLPATNEQEQPALWMCYGGAVGFGGYGGYYGYQRRVRFFEIDTNEARITTYKRLEWGDTESRIDEQIAIDGGKIAL